MSEVEEITAEDTGKFLITTQGSQHIWDNDERTWTRLQRDGLNKMDHDGRKVRIQRVKRFPKVGGVFYIWFEDQWHQSSTIRKIERITDE